MKHPALTRIFAVVLAVFCLVALCSAGLAETLTLPADLMTVEAEAFMGDASLKTVVLPDGL